MVDLAFGIEAMQMKKICGQTDKNLYDDNKT